MARMIPPAYRRDCPAGERELFEKLRHDPKTANWVVLHSLDVKQHRTKVEGELDMVVIVPDLGVLCIEVKGCSVSRRDGNWIYPYGTSSEGPFKQVSRSMHSLREYVASKDRSLSNLLFFSAVVFTSAEFSEASPEWHAWQFVERSRFLRRPISTSLAEILNRAHAHFKEKQGRHAWYDESRTRPTIDQVSNLVRLLRAEFEYPVPARHDLEKVEREIHSFTEEQFDALDLLEENDRVVFRGPAGTGKTLLALEAARRSVHLGKRVLLVCYNRLLGEWLISQSTGLANISEAFRCGTFHSLLVSLSGERPPANPSQEYWHKFLPNRVTERLLECDKPMAQFDMLIVDEAQDLAMEEYLDVMDLILEGGLAGGQWAFFGDFERQAIYSSEHGVNAERVAATIAERSPSHVNAGLRVNCRNAVPIAHSLSIASRLNPGYRRVLHDIEGAEVDPLFYPSAEGQVLQLRSALAQLRRTFRPNEIVVLSMRSDSGSCARAAALADEALALHPIREQVGRGGTVYASVHAFKGLESPAVVITDIESVDEEHSRALLYVAMSRARVRLYMLMHERCRSSYDRILDDGIAMTARAKK